MNIQLNVEKLTEIVDITVSKSGLSAVIKINVDKDFKIDEPIPLKNLKFILEKNNINYGIDEQLLKNICSNLNNFINKDIEIAKGKEPINGQDGYIEWKFDLENKAIPKELEDGRIDFYTVSKINNIKTGQLIAQRIHSTSGEPGKDVYGNEIPAKKGKDAYLKPGKNVLLNEAKDLIYAAIDGQVTLTEKDKINVFPIYEVNGDLDFSIGNIDFVGTVIIRGSVPDGFKIKASGDIKVYGNVEGAELIADGDIFIQQGIIGHNKSLVRAKRNLKASFILDSEVYAAENIETTQSIMHSTVSAGNQVICKGLKGIIVGGKIQAANKVTATVIGNQLATGTIIEVGLNPELKRELNEIQQEKIKLVESQDKIDKGIKILNQIQNSLGHLPPDKKSMQLKLINQKLEVDKKLKEIINREKELEEQLTQSENACIEVFKISYPGVKLIFGNKIKIIKQEIQHMRFSLEDGIILSTPL